MLTPALAAALAVAAALSAPQALAEPAEDGNLYASSGALWGPMVVEVVVSGYVGADPSVTLDGKRVAMVQGSGEDRWYAYVAGLEAARLADGATRIPATGMDFGTECGSPAFADFDPAAVVFRAGEECGEGGQRVLNVLGAVKHPADSRLHDGAHWPFIQAFELQEGPAVLAHGDRSVEIAVGDPGGRSVSLGAATYAPGRDVALEIRDPMLNLDPTTRDEWTFDADGAEAYWLLFDKSGDLVSAGGEEISPEDVYHYGDIMEEAGFGSPVFRAGGSVEFKDNELQHSGQVAPIGGPLVTVLETGPNTGVFSNKDRLGAANMRAGGEPGLTVTYRDQEASAASGEARFRAEMSPPRPVDSSGNDLAAVSAGSQVLLTSEITAPGGPVDRFTYLVRIQDSSGAAVSLSWVAGSLAGGHPTSPALSWTPGGPGEYEVTAFLWESIPNPAALAAPARSTVTVN